MPRGADGLAAATPSDSDAERTSDHTFCWLLSAMALRRTLGCAIWEWNEPKLDLVATQRVGSTQNTARSIGSLFGGTMRSLPTTRSCLPPVTISDRKSTRLNSSHANISY